MSFSKPQFSFSSNFAWLFSVTKYTPLYFFRSNVVYFAQKGPIKVQIFQTFYSAQIKNHQILVIFEKMISFSSNFAALFGIMRHNSSILFLAETFSKSSLSKYKFGEISPEQSKVSNFALWWAPFVKTK